jgi:hypothetical protein
LREWSCILICTFHLRLVGQLDQPDYLSCRHQPDCHLNLISENTVPAYHGVVKHLSLQSFSNDQVQMI